MTKIKLYKKGDLQRMVALSVSAEEKYRSDFRRDYARLVHSAAFRRLQGKTQLFPSHESDFFRNRLTHSLEVAQVAKSIAIRINNTHEYFMKNNIDTDLIEVAALAHDLGHPPFGHNGEYALDECMKDMGGFEGNAQTLRILCRLEKRELLSLSDGIRNPILDETDQRVGLNLTFRTLAAVLKYDRAIPYFAEERKPKNALAKGYYQSEKDIIKKVKEGVGYDPGRPFRTIECSIMDISDDIAYSTYDLEDSFKAGFLSQLKILCMNNDVIKKVSAEVQQRLDQYYPDIPTAERVFPENNVLTTLLSIFSPGEDPLLIADGKIKEQPEMIVQFAKLSEQMASNGYYRTDFTSSLVGRFIRGIEVHGFNEKMPWLSGVRLKVEIFKQVEVLKNMCYQSLIMSSMLKVSEYRGKDIVKKIFKALTEDGGHLLMPDDHRLLYNSFNKPEDKRRVACDFISGMTDRYAIQFYGRLYSTSPESIYSPI